MEDYLISNEEDILPAMDDQVDQSLELVEIFMTVKGDPSTGMLWVEGIPTGVFVSEVPNGKYKYFSALEAFNNNQINGGSLI